MSQSSFQNAPIIQPSNVASRFPAVVDPLTQAAVAQVGAVYQAAAAAAYKAVAASGLVPNFPQNVPSVAAQPSQPQPGLYTLVFVLCVAV